MVCGIDPAVLAKLLGMDINKWVCKDKCTISSHFDL